MREKEVALKNVVVFNGQPRQSDRFFGLFFEGFNLGKTFGFKVMSSGSLLISPLSGKSQSSAIFVHTNTVYTGFLTNN